MSNPAAVPPIACTLTPDQLRCRSRELLPGLANRASSAAWTLSGIDLRFAASSENLASIAETIDKERQCCAFLDFVLRVPQSGQEFLLQVTGPEGTRAFLEDLGLPI